MGKGCRCLDVIERVLSGDYGPVYRRLVADANLLNGRWKAYKTGRIRLFELDSEILKLAYDSVMVRLGGAGLELDFKPDAREPRKRRR